MKQIVVFRPLVSRYQGTSFRESEEKAFLELGLRYTADINEITNSDDVILITTTNCEIKFIEELLVGLKPILWLHPNSGYDNITTTHLKNVSCPVITGNEIRAKAVFQYIVECLLKATGSIPFVQKWDSDRSFSRSFKKKVLVYGKGHIGSLLESYLNLTPYQYEFVDPYQKLTTKMSLEEADIFILACSLNKNNYHLFDEDFFSVIKKDAVIINPARGKLIDFNSLKSFLKSNDKAQGFIDVFENEPYPMEKINLENIHMSSHIAGVYDEIDDAIIQFEFDAIANFLELSNDQFLTRYQMANLKNKNKEDFLK